ncbi:hypothetical protein [Roseomonas indoligenes]|uniref:Uncharacterized protein n=1 Tax=Roseomonas indoligenes TaxID=2820811 RepID=A0A940S7G0_9PROT|nr:hypothetical protein [Pararoseomonas indoligenes]MBP0493033.1 hypothetical protein [Pararoseomonas indoligenes]
MSGALPVHVTLRAFFGAAYTGLPFSCSTGTTLLLTIEARNTATGQPVDVSGLRVRQYRPDGAAITLDEDEIGHAATGRYSAEIFVGPSGDWTMHVECEEPRPAETVAWLRASGPNVASPTLGGSEGVLAAPGNRPFDVTLFKDVQAAAPRTGTEGLLIGQDDEDGVTQPRFIPVEEFWEDNRQAVAPLVEQVDNDAQAVELSRQEVADTAAGLPAAVAGQVGAQVPPAVEGELAVQAPPVVAGLAQPYVAAAQDAANNTAAAVVNAARMALTLTALQASTPTPAAGALGNVYGTGTDRGLYQYLSGAWTYQGLTLADLLAMVSRSNNDPASLVVKDVNGNVGLELSGDGKLFYMAGALIQQAADGTVTVGRFGSGGAVELLPSGRARIGGVTLSQNAATDYQIGLSDEFGNIIPISLGGSSGGSGGGSSTTFTFGEIAAFDATALGRAETLRAAPKARTQPILNGAVNFIPGDGQSFANGGGSGPGITRTVTPGCLMVGTSPRFTLGGPTAVPATDAAFHDLVSTPASEFYQVGAIHALRRLDCAMRGVPLTSTERVLASQALGFPGVSLEQLAYGAPPRPGDEQNLWTYNSQIYAAARAAASAQGKPLVVPAVLQDQGQANVAGAGLANTAEAYCAGVLQRVANWITYQMPLTDNAYPPLFVLHQTSGGYQQDTFQNGVSQGQMLAAERSPYVVVSQPFGNYQQSGTDEHPAANGHGTGGEKDAEVLHEVLNLGRGWEPLRPVSIAWRGREILIGLSPRRAPIRWARPFDSWTRVNPANYPNRGFAVSDSLGGLTISAVEIVGAATVRLTVNRTPNEAPWVTAGSAAAAGGLTFIEDSDDGLTLASYRYVAGMDPAENLPDEVGKPYRRANQLVTFRQQATAA